MSDQIVTVEQLIFRYEDSAAATLPGVNLAVSSGEAVLILGPSGCGKSTLLLCLNGIIPQHLGGEFSGRVTVTGRDVTTHPTHELAAHIGMVFQDPEAQFCTLSVADEVAFGLENLRYPRDVIQQRVTWALRQVGLADKASDRLDRLSGGQKQKVVLASVLAMDPAVLVLDAPTANLDPMSARNFYTLLCHLHQETGKTLIIVEQHIDACIAMVDRLVLMDERGQIMSNGPPRAVFAALPPETLERYGIWTPQVWDLTETLRRQGQPFSEVPLTVDEAVAAFRPMLNGNGNGQSTDVLPAIANDTRTLTERPAIIQVNDLCHTYRTPTGSTAALQHVNVTLRAGDFCAIVGQNGAGKTTLAKHLTRILEPKPGQLFFAGQDITTIPLRQLTEQIGYVFQNPEHQFVANTVYDELAHGLRVRQVPEATVQARVGDILDRLRLRSLAHSRPFTLSRGEQRRLSVATMLVTNPALLILDEPTIGLDKAATTELMNMLCEHNDQGTTIIFITHDMRLVAEYAQTVIVMADSTVIFQGQVDTLFDQPDVMTAAMLLDPPVVALARQLRTIHPTFPTVTSVRAFQQVWEAV